jgi:hypothetical protein
VFNSAFTSVSCYLLLKYDSKNQVRPSRNSCRVAWHAVFPHFRRSPLASVIVHTPCSQPFAPGGKPSSNIGQAYVGLSDRQAIGRQLSAETRVVYRASWIKASHVAIAASLSSMGGIVGFEVIATREAALALRNPADI